MTTRTLAAHHFVLAFEAVSRIVGASAALRDPRVQAARRHYNRERFELRVAA